MSSAGACHAVGGGVNFLIVLSLLEGLRSGGGGGGWGVVESLPNLHIVTSRKM